MFCCVAQLEKDSCTSVLLSEILRFYLSDTNAPLPICFSLLDPHRLWMAMQPKLPAKSSALLLSVIWLQKLTRQQ